MTKASDNLVERVCTFQDVYDLIIKTCQDDPEFHAWGASALRFLNRIENTRIETLTAALLGAGEALESVLPRNVCLTNRNVRGETIVPLDVTMGELRRVVDRLETIRRIAPGFGGGG